MSDQVYSSRRERRLAEQGLLAEQPLADKEISNSAEAVPSGFEATPLPSRRELRARQASQTHSEGSSASPVEFSPLVADANLPVVTSASSVEPAATSTGSLFEISPSMSHEPQTNSIIIQNVNEISEISGVITDTGQFLRTGSIELPKLTQTGEIATILESPSVDEAIHRDGFDSFVSSIAPVRATGVINSQTKVGMMPIKNRRGQGQFLFAITTTLLMLTVGALFVVAYMLGVFDK